MMSQKYNIHVLGGHIGQDTIVNERGTILLQTEQASWLEPNRGEKSHHIREQHKFEAACHNIVT